MPTAQKPLRFIRFWVNPFLILGSRRPPTRSAPKLVNGESRRVAPMEVLFCLRRQIYKNKRLRGIRLTFLRLMKMSEFGIQNRELRRFQFHIHNHNHNIHISGSYIDEE